MRCSSHVHPKSYPHSAPMNHMHLNEGKDSGAEILLQRPIKSHSLLMQGTYSTTLSNRISAFIGFFLKCAWVGHGSDRNKLVLGLFCLSIAFCMESTFAVSVRLSVAQLPVAEWKRSCHQIFMSLGEKERRERTLNSK